MAEKEDSVILANRILDNHHMHDPDGDLSVLARQLLRREERLQSILAVCGDDNTTRIAKIRRIAEGLEI
jgi:hypothetical protein